MPDYTSFYVDLFSSIHALPKEENPYTLGHCVLCGAWLDEDPHLERCPITLENLGKQRNQVAETSKRG